MSINASDSLPSFQLIGVGFYSGSGTPTFATDMAVALYFNTAGSTNTTIYVTVNSGTNWTAVTSA
jgi:hypothetical protein